MRCPNAIWKVWVACLLGALDGLAGDIRLGVPDFNRWVVFKENGNVRVEGRIFANIFQPPFFGSVLVENQFQHEKAGIGGSNIFLQGSVFQNQSAFPGAVKWYSSTGAIIASIDNDGNLYVDNVIEDAGGCMAPVWENWKWIGGDVQFENNCYNYANNMLTFSRAEPGMASNYDRNGQFTVDAWRSAALADGLSWVGWNFPGNAYTCPNSGTLVFLTLDLLFPFPDFHWYRLDKANGKWTHKAGGNPPSDVDASGAVISNPLASNRNFSSSLNYTENGGFYCTCGGKAYVR